LTSDTTTHEDILSALDVWLKRQVVPQVRELEHSDTYPREIVEQMREFGLFGATIPTQYGGLGMTASLYSKVIEKLSAVWISISGVVNSHLMMAELINRFGTEEQKLEILPLCATGELRGGMGLTEPQCGSDLQAIRTRAERSGDGGYVINGMKTWITNAGEGNCLAVLLKTDNNIEPRHRGMSLFFVRKRDGYQVGKRLGKLGYKGIDTVEVFFDDVHVRQNQLIGEQEGLGFKQTVGALELGRINVASRGAGVADAALQAALHYSRTRETMGKPIGQHQAIQLKLADMACRVASSRALIAIAAEAFDAGRRCDLEAGMAKLVASEAAWANATASLQIHGAYGYSTEVDVERLYRDAPCLSIGEGTSDIQRILIAQRLLAE
jgi:alkylation response protein AidB-like acyl-CoA dehydrogenase